jgi:hypothetical protein
LVIDRTIFVNNFVLGGVAAGAIVNCQAIQPRKSIARDRESVRIDLVLVGAEWPTGAAR